VPYDIIIMDCQMPEKDGYEVSRAIRQEQPSTGSRPYIIALTANAMHGDRERCLQAGMNDYLTKPLQLADLESSLQRALLRVQPVRRPRAPTRSSDTLDLGILAGLRELASPQNPDPLKELVDLFLKDARLRLQRLAVALAAKDAAAVASTAHTLKGSANNLGARQLASLLANLETQAKAGNLTDSANILLNVGSEFQEVELALLAELHK
jgi:CheY-like chemotaxis protein